MFKFRLNRSYTTKEESTETYTTQKISLLAGRQVTEYRKILQNKA